VTRFLSAEWVERFNDALQGVDLSGAQGDASTVASERAITVAQEVTGAPDGPVRTVLSIDGPTVIMALGEAAEAGHADVTITLDYADAAALSRGELDPAGALGAGRVRVRGDLSVLVAAQTVLAAAAGHLSELTAATTY
jgi:hypothetical protein